MQRQRYRELKAVLMSLRHQHHDDPRCRYRDTTILAVWLWAVLHDRPVYWAVNPSNWPADLRPRGGLPSQSCMSRRLRLPRILELTDRFERAMRAKLPSTDIKLVDARPLPTGGCSKDPDAATGHGAGHLQRGYKLHMVCDSSGSVDHWIVTAMNGSESQAAGQMIPHMTATRYVFADGNYDVNALYDAAGERGMQWIASPHRRNSQQPGHRAHSPHRLTWWSWIRSPHGSRTINRIRSGIERINAWQGHAQIGLHHLPHHVRRLHRVRLWVAYKLILYHHWLIQKRARPAAA